MFIKTLENNKTQKRTNILEFCTESKQKVSNDRYKQIAYKMLRIRNKQMR